MENKKQNIVILGAGFAGLRCALDLAKEIHRFPNFQIILINKTDTHLYTPDLYEIATAYYKTITSSCLTNLKETVVTKIPSLISGKPIIFWQDTVTKIQPEKKTVLLEQGMNGMNEIPYEYLVIASGSITNYYQIPGLEQFSYPLKTIADGLAIQCHLDSYFQTLWRSHLKKSVHIVVGGGGATGCELVAELPAYIKKLCKKYEYPFEQVEITLVEGKKELIGLGPKLASLVQKRLVKLGVKLMLGTYITKAEVSKIRIKSKEGVENEIPVDMLIWTGGVMPNPLLKQSFEKVSKNGAVEVNEFLEAKYYPKIFAAGDNAAFDPPLPLLAQIAQKQGGVVAFNMLADIAGKSKKEYVLEMKGVVIPLGGKYAVFQRSGIVIAGFFVWVLRRLIDLTYALSIIPFGQALRKWWRATNIFVQND